MQDPDRRSKRPSFQFYPSDWRKDIGLSSLDHEHKGLWIDLMCLMHDSPRYGYLCVQNPGTSGLLRADFRPMSARSIAKVLAIDVRRLRRLMDGLISENVPGVEPETGILYSRRMVRDEQLREKRAAAGRLGGNPILLNQEVNTPKKQEVKQKTTPSSSSSSSSSSSPPDSPNPPEKRNSWAKAHSSAAASGRPRDLAFDLYAERYAQERGVPYREKKGDFVQLHRLRKAMGLENRTAPPGWEAALSNYLASPLTAYTLADLCSRFDVFVNSAVDRYGRPDESPGAKLRMQREAENELFQEHLEDARSRRAEDTP